MSYIRDSRIGGLGLMAATLLLAACAPKAEPISLTDAAPAQRAWTAACKDMDEWDKPGPPFRVHGSTYYVGTCGITSLLVAGPEGHVLIDSGTDKGADLVLANIRALGFTPRDVKAILMSHEHFDHIGGMAKLQAATGAPVYATRQAAAVLRSGRPGPGDPQEDAGHPPFTGTSGRIVVLTKAAPLRLAGREFQPLFSPGHTPGATSWRWRECDGADCKALVYTDSLSAVSADSYRFSDHPAYLATYRKSLAALAALQCDIVLAPHPTAARLRDRLLGTRPLVDGNGCRDYAARFGKMLDERLAKEKAG